ncbi:MAG TPA: protein BatD [Caldithrix abyssi]|uniref:Protein BatD n=1 Tax=Caldithrix abyssi TaxID=187145 RepID=A0A7V4U1B0_CALAY|nr:protein BatD [Caldithrix abyssi]
MKKHITKTRYLLLFAVLVSAAGALRAEDEITLRATVDRNTVAPDQQFRYTIEVSGKSMSLPDVQFPALDDFYVLSGPNTSTSVQWINGAMSSSKSFSFYLRPKKEGKFIIGKAYLTYNDKTYESNTITITVTKSAGVASAPASKGKKAPPKQSKDASVAGKDLFLKTEVSRRKAFIGQQIVVEYKLYFRVNVRGYNVDKMPASAGFWTEEFKMPNQPVISNEIVNGVNYNVATLRKVALFPTQSGKLTIEPMQITLEALVRASRRRRSLFDSFFDDPFGRTVQKTVISKPVTVTVAELPQEGRPSTFGGAVGRFRFDAQLDKQEVAVDEPVSLKMQISGSGNIKLVQLPKIQTPPDLEQYEPKVATHINNDGARISGRKSAEYVLIPRNEGTFEIKELSFSYFDPQQKKYNTVKRGPFVIRVRAGEGQRLSGRRASGLLNRQEVELLGKDIRFIKEESDFSPIGYRVYLSAGFWLSILGALLLFIGFFIYNERQTRLLSDERLARLVKAGKIATRQLAEAKKMIGAAEQSAFYRAVTSALQGFVQNKMNIDLTDFSEENIRRVLGQKGVDDQVIEEYMSVLQESDFRQFASIPADEAERKTFYEKARSVLTRLEKWM